MVVTYIGFGSNIGCKEKNLRRAKEKLRGYSHLTFKKGSSFYFSEPVGNPNQPWFINCAARLITDLEAGEIFGICKDIEGSLGRKKSKKSGPRIIDLDILLVGNQVLQTPNLQLPHPELHKRKFVLLPLLELNEELRHPGLEKSLKNILNQMDQEKKVVKSAKKGF